MLHLIGIGLIILNLGGVAFLIASAFFIFVVSVGSRPFTFALTPRVKVVVILFVVFFLLLQLSLRFLQLAFFFLCSSLGLGAIRRVLLTAHLVHIELLGAALVCQTGILQAMFLHVLVDAGKICLVKHAEFDITGGGGDDKVECVAQDGGVGDAGNGSKVKEGERLLEAIEDTYRGEEEIA